jgi:hypothetical protein
MLLLMLNISSFKNEVLISLYTQKIIINFIIYTLDHRK